MALLSIPSSFQIWFFSVFLLTVLASEWIDYPSDGSELSIASFFDFWYLQNYRFATLTHYSLPLDYIASCGCTADSTHYPTAALSQMAYGSSTAYGPACGRCFNLTLLNTFLSVPPFYPPKPKSIVVKVTDLCPLSTIGWCNATTNGPNAYVTVGFNIHSLPLIFSEYVSPYKVQEIFWILILHILRPRYPRTSSHRMRLIMDTR